MTDHTGKKVILIDGDISNDIIEVLQKKLGNKFVLYTREDLINLEISLDQIEETWIEDAYQRATEELELQKTVKRILMGLDDESYLIRNRQKSKNISSEHLHPKNREKLRPPRKLTKCKNGWR